MIFRLIGDILFPPECLGCGVGIRSGALCEDCRNSITLSKTLGAATNYEDRVVQSLIHGLKFDGIRNAAKPLGEILADYVTQLALSFDDPIVVPIPLSKKRFRSRGFNQAELIARTFAEQLRMPMATNLLVRTRHCKPQSETSDIAERRENVIGCFSAGAGCDGAREKDILLIDDVTTSGTTFTEAVKTLNGAGIQKITTLAVAKA